MPGTDCKVCGRIQPTFCLRYGGQACSGCATFFYRSNNESHDYACIGSYSLCLAIPTLTGSSCRKCRYQRCLDIGMIHGKTVKVEKNKIEECGEYYTLAKKLNNLFIIITKSPELLLKYLDDNEDVTLLDRAKELLPNSPLTNYLLPWAELWLCNQVPLDRIYLLFYSIICKIKMPSLSFLDQMILSEFQKKTAHKKLIPSEYGSIEIQEGFEKLTNFFVSQFQTYFS